jgi:hypothetical protein
VFASEEAVEFPIDLQGTCEIQPKLPTDQEMDQDAEQRTEHYGRNDCG